MTPHDLSRAPTTDPTEIYRYRDGIYAVDLLNAAIVHLDFFSWLDRNPGTAESICASLSLSPRPLDVMLTFFKALGLIREENGAFHTTPMVREHLVTGSPWHLGPYFASLRDRPVCRDLLEVLRTGKAANWGSSKDEKEWARAMQEEGFAERFTAAMDCRGAYLGQALASRLKPGTRTRLLDIAGGSGIYACAITAIHPQIRASVFERPPVDQVARTLIGRRGFDDRVKVIAGDMFKDPLPGGFDLHLFSNVLHDWDFPKVRALLKASFAALEPGGMLVIHDAHINAAKDGPLPVAEYSVILMHSTEGKCYSIDEMKGLLKEAGFGPLNFLPTAADRSIITVEKPR
jgi:SAM-dependent methyltransferase